MPDPTLQFPPETFPGQPNFGKSALLTFDQIIKARQAQEQQALQARAQNPNQQAQGRPGQLIGSVAPPSIPGTTSAPGGLPATGVPPGGLGQPNLGGVPGMNMPPRMPQGPVDLGSSGQLPSLAPKFIGTAAPQIPYNQEQYATGSQRRQQVISNTLAGIYNAVQQRKDTNEKKQFQEAENTYAQIVAAQTALQQNPNDQNARAQLDAILTDPKKLKMLDESLGYTLPKEPSPADQKKAQSPAVQGAQSFWRKFAQRVGGGVQQTFDPRTATQRQFGGAQAPPSGPGTLPAPNTPGGVMFPIPQKSTTQTLMDAEKQELLLRHPEWREQIEKQDLKIIPGPEAQAKLEIQRANAAQKREYNDARLAQNQARLDEAKRKDDMNFQLGQDRIDAYVQAHRARLGDVSATAVSTWAKRYQQGDVTIAQVPKELKTEVIEATAGLPIARKLNNQQLQVFETLGQMSPILDKFTKGINKYIELNPDYEDDTGWAGVTNWLSAKVTAGVYRAGAEPSDEARAELMREAAALSVMGAAPWVRIGRGRWTYEQIQQHLPQIGDTPAKMRENAKFLGEIASDSLQEIQQYRWGENIGGPTGLPSMQQQLPGMRPDMVVAPQPDLVITPEDMRQPKQP
jgi:hypothetical protein